MPRQRNHFNALRQVLPALILTGYLPVAQAEKVAVALSQEQDGGAAGRACIYVHQGKAEYRVVKAGQACAPEIIVEKNQS